MAHKRRINRKQFNMHCFIGAFQFFASKYSPKKKLDNLITYQALISNKPRAHWNCSNSGWLIKAHDSSKCIIAKIDSNQKFITMLKHMRQQFVADKKKPGGLSRFSYILKTVRRTPHVCQFLLSMAELLTSGAAVIKDNKVKFVPQKN